MFDLTLSAEQEALLNAVAGFIRRELPIDRLRPKPGAFLPVPVADDWSRFGELGWLGLSLPESSGGAGYGLPEEVVVFHEFGRYLLTPCLLASVVAAQLAHHCGDLATARGLASGEHRVAVALPIDQALTGSDHNCHLLDASSAKMVLLLGGALDLYERSAFADVLEVTGLDPSVPLQRARLSVRVRPLLSSSDIFLLNRTSILISAMQSGITEASLDLAVEYAKLREQFGRPIGSFQAIKHKCADMAVNAEAATSQTRLAALSLGNRLADADYQVASAAVIANRAATANGEECIQIHGGMGFTVECDAHLFLKRALLNARLLGGTELALERVLASSNAMD